MYKHLFWHMFLPAEPKTLSRLAWVGWLQLRNVEGAFQTHPRLYNVYCVMRTAVLKLRVCLGNARWRKTSTRTSGGERHSPEHQRHRPVSLAGNRYGLCPAVLGIFRLGNHNLCIQRVFSWLWSVSRTTQDAFESPGIHSSSRGRSLPCIFLADKLLVSYPNGHPPSQRTKSLQCYKNSPRTLSFN